MPKPEGVKKTWFAPNHDEAVEVYNSEPKNLPIASPIYKTSEDIGLSEKFPFSQKANADGGCYFYSGMIAILNDCVGDAENWNSVRGNLIRIAGEDGEFKALIDEISPENAVLTREKVYEILQVRGEKNIIAKLGDKLLVNGIAHSSGKTTWGLDHFLTQANEALEAYLDTGVVTLESLSSKDRKLIEGIKSISSEEMSYLSDEHFDSQDQDLRQLCEGVIRCQWAIKNRRRPGTYNAEYISPFFQAIYPTKRIVAITRRDLATTVVEAGALYLWNEDGQAHFDVLYPGTGGKIAADVAALSEPEVETLGGKVTETITEKVEQFVATLVSKYAAPKDEGSEISSLDNLPSPAATRAFLELRAEEQHRILEGTRITITRAEFDHAKKFLALIALTEGQQIPGKKSQKQIYVDQGILPKDLALADADGDLGDQIEQISAQITPEHIKAFYKRLVEKRPLVSFGVNDYTLLRTGEESQADDERSIGCSGTHDPEQYTLYSEAEFASMLQVFGPTQFINDGERNNRGIAKVWVDSPHEASGYISGLVGMRLEIADGMESVHVVEGNLTKLKKAHADSPAPAWGGDQKGDFGRIFGVTSKFVEGYEAIWQKFYEDKKGELGEEEVDPKKVIKAGEFDKAAAGYRLYISYKKFLAESANAIAERERKREGEEKEKAYIRITGLGDGVWAKGKVKEVREAIGRAVARAYDELAPKLKARISAIEFSEHEEHGLSSAAFFAAPIPEGAVDSQPELRVSNGHFAHKIPAAAEFKNVLFVNYAWDGLSYPGNEYYLGALNASGDPAAACCSSIVVSQNPQINSSFLDRVFVVEKNGITKDIDTIEVSSYHVDLGVIHSSSEGGSEEEPEEEKKSYEYLKYEALLAMQEIRKKSVSDNKLARAFKKLEGKEVGEKPDFEKIWKKELTTPDRIKLVEFYNERNSAKRIDFDENFSMNTLDLRRDGDLWETNKANLSKIIIWSIDLANREGNKTTTERIISAAEASNKRFHGTSSKEKGEIEKGVKQFREYRREASPSGKALNPIAQALVKRFPEKEK